VRELRREHFGPELAETLFGEEEAATGVALEMRRVAADPTLAPDEKSERLEALEARLPEDVRRARTDARAPLQLIEAERALRASGASAGEIQALRESRLGPDAAARLAALDRERAAWQARLDAWRAARERIRGDPTLDPVAREAALDRALAERFDATEQHRVRVLDAIEAARTDR